MKNQSLAKKLGMPVWAELAAVMILIAGFLIVTGGCAPRRAVVVTGAPVHTKVVYIRRQDKSRQWTQMTETEGTIAALPDESAASYRGRKTKIRILCGSI